MAAAGLPAGSQHGHAGLDPVGRQRALSDPLTVPGNSMVSWRSSWSSRRFSNKLSPDDAPVVRSMDAMVSAVAHKQEGIVRQSVTIRKMRPKSGHDESEFDAETEYNGGFSTDELGSESSSSRGDGNMEVPERESSDEEIWSFGSVLNSAKEADVAVQSIENTFEKEHVPRLMTVQSLRTDVAPEEESIRSWSLGVVPEEDSEDEFQGPALRELAARARQLQSTAADVEDQQQPKASQQRHFWWWG